MSVEFQRYIPHDAAVAEPNTNPLKAAVGHHDSASPLHSHNQPPVAMNNDYNPWAQPFTPNHAYPDQTNDQRRDRNQSQNTMGGYMPPASAANVSRYASHGRPQHFNPNGGQTYSNPAAQQQYLAQAYYYQWAQQYGINQGFTPLNPPQQALGQTPQRNYPFFAPSFAAMQPHSGFQGVSNSDLQYAFDELCKGTRKQYRRTNSGRRASNPLSDDEPVHIVATGPAKLKQKHHTVAPTGRSKERKIMLPPPAPTKAYMAQAAEDPCTVEPSGRILVILDLNGTLLYRPNRNVKTMIARPFLGPFLRYLFANFAVMVWSSARPENVSSLVEQSLEEDLRKSLVAQLARDAFNLKPEHYSANVQVYKNLELVWKREEIQRHHPDYEKGGRFGQHNTVLIDDSMLKASAQPFNLLLISEFSATPQQLQEDKLRDVAGYLDVLRTQQDVSKFMKREPFRHDLNKWTYVWPAEDTLAQSPAHKAGEVQTPGSKQELSKKKEKKAKKVKKNRKAKKREAEAKAAQAMELGVEQAAQSDDSGSEEENEASDGGIRLV